jgi:hypothetical protein
MKAETSVTFNRLHGIISQKTVLFTVKIAIVRAESATLSFKDEDEDCNKHGLL